MSFECGFFNAINEDRKYDAEEVGALFSGVIRDGVFMGVGGQLEVSQLSTPQMIVQVAEGRAWFDNSWSWVKDNPYHVIISPSNPTLPRYTTVVLETNFSDNVRQNTIKSIDGAFSLNPTPPTLIRSATVNQYALAEIYVPAGATSITDARITNKVGLGDTPFVTGILETMDVTQLINQWQAQWLEWFSNTQEEHDEWFLQEQAAFAIWSDAFAANAEAFQDAQQTAFLVWFANLKVNLEGNVATNLQNQINNLVEETYKLYYGLFETTTTINSEVTQLIAVSEYGTMTTTFNFDSESVLIIQNRIDTVVPGVMNMESTTTITFNPNGSTTVVTTYEAVV